MLYSVSAIVDGILRVAIDYPKCIVFIVLPIVFIVLAVRCVVKAFTPGRIKLMDSEMSAAERKVSPRKYFFFNTSLFKLYTNKLVFEGS